jgi:hypothetical protein
MRTTVLELVPTNVDDGTDRAEEVGRKAAELARACGLAGRIRHLMVPDMIAEEPDRPVEMRPKLDTLDFWRLVRPELGDVGGLCTQVTAFRDKDQLSDRLRRLRDADIEGVVFVGVPRTMADGEGPGVAPTDALAEFHDVMPDRGAILIPTRQAEPERFGSKCERGATFALTQLLYSDAIVDFLGRFAEQTPHRPDILLSFGYVAGVESRVKLIDWLIQDAGNAQAAAEQVVVAALAELPFAERKRRLVELYQRVVDGARDLGFPLSIHLGAPYGHSAAAFETFAEMLDYWTPGDPD